MSGGVGVCGVVALCGELLESRAASGTSIPVATGERSVADVFFVPLVIAMIGFGLLFLALVFYRTGTEIRLRRTKALLAREART